MDPTANAVTEHVQGSARLLTLAIVPSGWVVLAVAMQQAMGAYPLLDPDYHYLLSSLDLLAGNSVGMFYHPGTTAEVFGAVVIRAVHDWVSPGVELQSAVLLDPAGYIAAICVASALVIAIALYLFGLVVFKSTGNAWLAALLQLSIFITPVVANDTMARFKAEPFLVLASLMVMAVVVATVSRRGDCTTRDSVLLGVACGFGLATKFTFVSVACIPLILLRGNRSRLIFLASTAVVGVLFTLPIADRYIPMWQWMFDVASHTGIYGDGAPGVIDLASYGLGFRTLAGRSAMFGVILAFALSVLVWALLRARRLAIGDHGNDVRALVAVTVSQLAGFVLVAKYGSFADASRYLLGGYCMLGLTAWLAITVLRRSDLDAAPILRRGVTAVLLTASAVSLVATSVSMAQRHQMLRADRDRHARRDLQLARLEDGAFKAFARVYDMGYRSNVLALVQASFYSTAQFQALMRVYPDVYFCPVECSVDNWTTKQLVRVDANEFTAAEIAQKFGGRVVLFYGEDPRAAVVTPAAPAP